MPVRPGTEFIAKLPEGYDDRTRLAYYKPLRTIIVAHPDFPPCVLKDGELKPIEPCP
jgi:hypothetical protein